MTWSFLLCFLRFTFALNPSPHKGATLFSVVAQKNSLLFKKPDKLFYSKPFDLQMSYGNDILHRFGLLFKKKNQIKKVGKSNIE